MSNEEKKSRLLSAAEAITKTCENEKRGLTDIEKEYFDKLMAEFDDLAGNVRSIHRPDQNFNGDNRAERRIIICKPGANYGELFYGKRDMTYPNEFQNMTDAEIEKKAMMEAQGPTGGFTVPESWAASIYDYGMEGALIAPRCTPVRMDTVKVHVPTLPNENHTAGNLYGGLQLATQPEGATGTEQDMNFGDIELEADMYSLFLKFSIQLRDDGIGFVEQISRAAGNAYAFGRDCMLIDGSGIGSPLGVMNQNAKILVSRQTVATITYLDLANMVARAYPQFLPNMIWLANPDCFPSLATIKDENDNLVWQPNASQKSPQMLFGLPLFLTEKVRSLGTAGDLVLVDPSRMYLGTRREMSIMTSDSVFWHQNMVAMKLLVRFDAAGMIQNPITPRYGSKTLSWIVVLN